MTHHSITMRYNSAQEITEEDTKTIEDYFKIAGITTIFPKSYEVKCEVTPNNRVITTEYLAKFTFKTDPTFGQWYDPKDFEEHFWSKTKPFEVIERSWETKCQFSDQDTLGAEATSDYCYSHQAFH